MDSDLAVFKAKLDFTTRLMNKARGEFYSNFIDENGGDQKKLFRASQRLFNGTVDDGLPPNVDSRTFSNDLGKYFVQKIDTIRAQLDSDQQTDSFLEDDTLLLSRLIHFQKMTLRLLFFIRLIHFQ